MTTNRTLSSVERSYEVVDALKRLNGARVTELASEMGLAPSTVHKHLATLEGLGFVVQEGDTYYVGLSYLTLGAFARNRREGYRLAAPVVRQLAEETGERAQFVVEEHGRGFYLHKEGEEHAVMIDRHVGKRRSLHSSAAGKAILANLPEERFREIVDRRGLASETEHTITDEAELREELSQVRADGIAYNDEESVDGLRAVGAPVIGPDDAVLGALSVSGPAHRLKGDVYRTEIPDLLLGYANELELNVTY